MAVVLIPACHDDDLIEADADQRADQAAGVRTDDLTLPPAGPGSTVLGERLTNPYSMSNMAEAWSELYGTSPDFSPSHYYIKFIPTSGDHIMAIADFEEEGGYEFESQPIDYEVLYQGDDGYIDPSIPATGGFGPEYGAVTAADYEAGRLPNVPYELIETMYIPPYLSHLTFIAFVLSGNEADYEAVDDFCHPDCPYWPECMEDETLSCKPIGNNASNALLSTMPSYAGERINFPDYILDGAMGMEGDVVIQGYNHDPNACRPVKRRNEACQPRCWIKVIPASPAVQDEGYECMEVCTCEHLATTRPPDDTPSEATSDCYCSKRGTRRNVAGRVLVEDTQLGYEGIQYVKVKSTKHRWGFIWSHTDSNEWGCFNMDKIYRVRRGKVKVVFKNRVQDRFVIRSVRGARVWNAILKPIKHTFYIRVAKARSERRWNDLCLRIDYTTDDRSRDEQSHVTATINNALHEYYDEHLDLPTVDGKLRILVQSFGGNSAPMFKQMGAFSFTLYDFNRFLVNFGAVAYNPVVTGLIWEFIKPDIIKDMGDVDLSDDIKMVMYHELSHSSQFAMLGDDYWEDYVDFTISASDDEPDPYGDGTRAGSGMAEVTEGMAESIARYMADLQYGLNHSNGGEPQIDRHINFAEQLTYWSDTQDSVFADLDFVPEGLFFDLFDQNGVSPTTVSASEPSGIVDPVHGYTFDQQMQALQSEPRTIAAFKTSLFNRYGLTPGVTQADYDALFDAYD